jgi:hypothetical protein
MMPDGLKFVSSWVAADLGRCFQLMETNDITLLQRWITGGMTAGRIGGDLNALHGILRCGNRALAREQRTQASQALRLDS